MRVHIALLVLVGAFIAAGTAWTQESAVKLSMDDRAVSVLAQGQPMFTYCFGQVPFKPYVQSFSTPGGVNVLRDSPEDHKHHHALMFALAVDDVNYWEEIKDCGIQRHRQFADAGTVEIDKMPWARFTEVLDWVNPKDNAVALVEHRTIAVGRVDALKASVIRWQSKLEVPEGKAAAKLGGGHYYGLGMRFVKSMDEKRDFMLAGDEKGELVRGDEYLTPSAWCAYSAEADGKPVTVAMFDHPGNPRPVKWFTMHTPFAYLSATINLWKEPMELKAGQPIVLNYCAALWDGKVDKEAVAAFNKQWLMWTAPGN